MLKWFAVLAIAISSSISSAAYYTCAADDHLSSKLQVSQSPSLAKSQTAAMANCRRVSRAPKNCSLMACRKTTYAPLGESRNSTSIPSRPRSGDACIRQCQHGGGGISECSIQCAQDSGAVRQCVNRGGNLGECEIESKSEQGCFRACTARGTSVGECNAQCS